MLLVRQGKYYKVSKIKHANTMFLSKFNKMCSFTEKKKFSPTIYNRFFKKSSEN